MTNKIKTLTQIIRIKLSIWRLKKNLRIGSFDPFKGQFTQITNKLYITYITSFYKDQGVP